MLCFTEATFVPFVDFTSNENWLLKFVVVAKAQMENIYVKKTGKSFVLIKVALNIPMILYNLQTAIL